MKFIAHEGAPCIPAVVNGVEFKAHKDTGFFIAKVEDDHDQLATFEAHPNFLVLDSLDGIGAAESKDGGALKNRSEVLQAAIAELMEKKEEDGSLSFQDNMKLGKLTKELKDLTDAASGQ